MPYLIYKPHKIRSLISFFRVSGMNPDEILDGSGYTWQDIRELRPCDPISIVRIYDRIADRVPHSLALQAGLEARVQDVGLVGFNLINCLTVKDLIENWIRYSAISEHPLSYSFDDCGSTWQYTIRPRWPMSAKTFRFCLETNISEIGPVLADLTGQRIIPQRIDLPFSVNGNASCYEAALGGRLRFNAPKACYVGLKRYLDIPVRTADPELHQFHISQCENALIEVRGNAPLSDRLRNSLLRNRGGIPNIREAALSLGVSVRSLQRRLVAEGTQYHRIVDEVRRLRANALLNGAPASQKQLAFDLGFDDPGSFRRAFRSWTGKTVGDWKKLSRTERQHLLIG